VTLPTTEGGPSTTETADGSDSGAGAEAVTRITIAAVGDITMHEDLLSSTWNAAEKYYDFGPVFAPVAPYLQSADYTVCNLETRVAGAQVGYSGYPLPNAPAALLHALADVGVDLAATANDHSLDWGWQGVIGTLGRLEAAGIEHVGTYQASVYKKTPLVVDIGGIKVGFLNYTSSLNGHGLPAGHEGYAVNVLSLDAVAEEAVMARMYGADVVIALLHYGIEYQREPSSEQTEVSEGSAEVRGLLARGVDVILGTQPRVVQPIHKVLQYSNLRPKDTYVAYSLGNFLSAERWRYADSGLIAYVDIEKRGLETDVIGIRYLPVYMQETAGDPVKHRILPVLPWLYPATDTAIGLDDMARMDQVWEELSGLLYRPDEGIGPVLPTDLGIE
jgi:poly-gamma-glutamate synthesis protein (capsule biosynthesis protein)